MGNLDHLLGAVSFLFIVIANVGFIKHKRWAFLAALTANFFWALQSYRIENWSYFVGVTLVLFPLGIWGWVRFEEQR